MTEIDVHSSCLVHRKISLNERISSVKMVLIRTSIRVTHTMSQSGLHVQLLFSTSVHRSPPELFQLRSQPYVLESWADKAYALIVRRMVHLLCTATRIKHYIRTKSPNTWSINSSSMLRMHIAL